jgi:hypothetical protein
MAVDAAGDQLGDAGQGLMGWAQHIQLQCVKRQQLNKPWQLGHALQAR